ncbi:MAG: 16S rRNA (cytosine(967)-C(5))-methyltransferase RsmB, partial [Lachnospiraceae bacterium]|nr:16S rRNA (cytosine(967)-C(5))-methyltransferase RsmB [Lachnospiraceae bacterium]
MINTRDIVLNILMDIETNKTFSNQAISKALSKNQFEDKRDRAFITRLAEGVMEQLITLDYTINQFSKTKVNKCKPMIRCILRMGVYQILYMESVPDSAACNESVKLAKAHGFGSLSGFVNGVLRNIARSKESIPEPSNDKSSVEYLSVKYSMPQWLCDKLKKDYPEQYIKILEGCFWDRATAIRVNETKISRDELKKELEEAGITVEDGNYDEKALLISDYDFIKRVPGYKKGFFTVQDESSMQAVRAAGIKPGDVVIDVCAAPGGKTTCAAEYLNGSGKLYSMDVSEDKLELIEENIERLGFDNVEI